MFNYEDKAEEVDKLLERSRKKWHLDAVQWMDYEDVCQIIRNHIHNKWHLWDQSRSFGPWANRVIGHQISNLIRNNYTSFQKPCLKCPHYTSDNGCAFTQSGVQDSSCADYEKWSKKKKCAHDVKLPLSLENQQVDNTVCINNEFDYEYSVNRVHLEVMKRLTNDKHRKIYRMLYIENLDEIAVTKQMEFSFEGGEGSRCKQLDNLKKLFYEIAQAVVQEEDVL